MSDDAVRLRRLLRALPEDIVELSAEDSVVEVSRESCRFRVGEHFFDGLPADFHETARRVIHLVRQDGVSRHFTYRDQGRDFSCAVSPLEPENAELCLAISDTTDAQVTERALTAERRRLEIALEASGVGLWSWHLPTNRVIWNERMHEMTGHETPLTLGEWVEVLTHPDDREFQRERAARARAPGPFATEVSRIVRPDGQVRWVMVAGTVIADGEGRPEWIVGGLMDVTEQQRVEDELKNAHRMESLAQLTGGVAHNFNNMLMVIAPCLEFIRETASGEILEDVDDAIKATRRASDIVAQLMTFSGRQNNRDKSVHPARDVVEETVRLCKRSFPRHISVQAEVTTSSFLEVIPGAIEQILGNVLFNARDALLASDTKDPRVRVVARDVTFFGEDWVEITVSDNGPGVPAEVGAKLFEPFVTSKRGSGTGLGLASSMALVQQHSGQMAYRPSSWGGAEFLILLPQHLEANDRASTESPAKKGSHGQGRKPDGVRLLIVDDEPAIRRVIRSGLPRFGFDVIEAEGRRDLESLLEEDNRFAVVLLDRSLGDEDGTHLLPLLRHRLPSAKVLFFTGEFISDSEAQLVEGVVQKPVTVRSLAGMLQELLAS